MRIKNFAYAFIFLGLFNGIGMCSEPALKSGSYKTTPTPFTIYTAVSPQTSPDSNIVATRDKSKNIFGLFRGSGVTKEKLQSLNDPLIKAIQEKIRLLSPKEVAQLVSDTLPKKIIEKQHNVEQIKQLFAVTNNIILNPRSAIKSMGSTSATIAHIDNNILYTYSVGDATIYLFEEGQPLELIATAQRSDANIGSPTFTINKLQIKQTDLNTRKNYILVLLTPGSYVDKQENAQKIIAQTAASTRTIAQQLTGLAQRPEQKDLTALVIKLKSTSLSPETITPPPVQKTAAQVHPQPIPGTPLETSSRIKLYAQAMVQQAQSWGNSVSEHIQAGWVSFKAWLDSWRR